MIKKRLSRFSRIGCLLVLSGVLGHALQLNAASSLHNQPPWPETGAANLQVLHPEERPAFSDDWRQRSQRSLRKGGHLYVILNLNAHRCAELDSSETDMQFFSMLPMPLVEGSDKESHAGWYFEVLVPRNTESCQQSPFVLAEWQPRHERPVHFFFKDPDLQKNKVEVRVEFKGHFNAPRRPMHIGLSNSFLLAGHCASYCPMEAELGHHYRDILLQHHLSPYHHWVRPLQVADGRLDLDAGSEHGISFRQMVLKPNAASVAFPRPPKQQDIAYLQALEKTIQEEGLIGRAWVLIRDEPGPEQWPHLLVELQRYRSYAPSVQTMLTTDKRPDLEGLVDIYAPLIHRQNRKGPLRSGELEHSKLYDSRDRIWLYTSCMGSCGPNRRQHIDIDRSRQRPAMEAAGHPDLLIDRPRQRLDDFFIRLATSGADGGLYYHAVEGYPLIQHINIFKDPWNFGGNGDGLLLWPGRPGEWGLTKHQALPSLRLKMMRRAIENYW